MTERRVEPIRAEIALLLQVVRENLLHENCSVCGDPPHAYAFLCRLGRLRIVPLCAGGRCAESALRSLSDVDRDRSP